MLSGRLAATLAIAGLAATASAQTVDSLGGVVARARIATTTPVISAGELVRVWAPTARLDGAEANFVRLDSNLVIAGQPPHPEAPARQWSVPIGTVQRLEVWRGTPRSKMRIAGGAVLGGFIGAGVGALLTKFIECGGACDREGKLRPTASPVLGAAIGAPIGALLGGVAAGMSLPKWRAVSLSVR